jgi:glycosyltransferase involved in cell wall biosynthesis
MSPSKFKSKDSISVVIPAYNEENSLLDAVNIVTRVLSHLVKEYEIIIVNDGSTDNTGDIANRIALKNKSVTVVNHKSNEGFGITFRDGIRIASKRYITGFPADNDLERETFEDIVTARKNDSIVITYATDMSQREVIRQIISIGYTKIMNSIFGLNLRYYNGYFICPTKLIKTLTLKSEGFTLFAEIKIKLIKKGIKYIELPYDCALRLYGTSKALTGKSILQALRFVPAIIGDIYFSKIENPR